MPIECIPYFIRTDALKVAHHMKQESNTEIWGPFVNRPDFFKIGYLTIEESPFKEEKRLTCDYAEDYILIKKIYDHFVNVNIPQSFDIIKYLSINTGLWEINEIYKQTQLDQGSLNKINGDFDVSI